MNYITIIGINERNYNYNHQNNTFIHNDYNFKGIGKCIYCPQSLN